jgi:hypothetical protein
MNCSQSAEVMSDEQQPLNDFTKKSLLLRIQKSNLCRSEVDLKEILQNDAFLGEEGNQLRCDIQIHWCNIKRQPIRSYVQCLKRDGIRIGDGTPDKSCKNLAPRHPHPHPQIHLRRKQPRKQPRIQQQQKPGGMRMTTSSLHCTRLYKTSHFLPKGIR